MNRRILLRSAASLLAAMLLSRGVAAQDCPVPPDLLQVSAKLPHLAERLAAKQPVKIVAIGGGSTRGAAAGDPDLAYPHRLQLALDAFYPDVPITVVNKGVPRQSTQQMVDRFGSDVLPEDPVLVVWETGISDAVRGIDPDAFAAALQAGIDLLKERAIDSLLVDMQFSRSTAAVIEFERYLNTIHRLGEVNDVYVFPRYEIMRYWSEQHIFSFDEVPQDERARLAAAVYACIGRELARVIREAVQ